MFKIKHTPYYTKYYIFGKCIIKRKKSIKQIAQYLLAEMENRYTDLKQQFDKLQINTTKFVKISDDVLVIDGFYRIENWGAWIKECARVYVFFCKPVINDVNLTIDVSKINTGDNKIKQELIVFVNNQYVTKFVTNKTKDSFSFTIPRSILNKCKNRVCLSFLTTNQISPNELGINSDKRKLSYGLINITSDTDIISSVFDSKDFYDVNKLQTSFMQQEWENYINENLDDKIMNNLCHNLSGKSVSIINTLLYRRQNKYSFSNNELYQRYLAWSKDISKYKIINKTGFQPEVFYFKNGLSFLDDKVVEKYLSKGCIIDGGACSGDSALMFSEYDFVKKVYAFEPLSVIYTDMVKTLKANKCNKVEAIKVGLGAKDGTDVVMGEKCKITTIDTFAKDKKISCIKLDVEGMEYDVIKGAIKTIKRDKPLLLICIYHTPKDFFEIKPMLESLNLGYKFKVVDTEPCNQNVGVHAMLIGYTE